MERDQLKTLIARLDALKAQLVTAIAATQAARDTPSRVLDDPSKPVQKRVK
jgi:ABC-type transporter Mla subunit MlaD